MAISLSGVVPYATSSDLIEIYGWRSVSDLLRDGPSGIRPAIGAVLASSVVDRHLRIASGRVETASGVNGRYKPETLFALAGNAKQSLVWLVSSIAFGTLVQFRFPSATEDDLAFLKSAHDMLDRLASGEYVWPLDITVDATTSDVIGREDRTVNAAWRMFGTRRNSTDTIGY